MKKFMQKRNLLLYVLSFAAAVVVAIFATVCLITAPYSAYAAEGNNAGSNVNTSARTIVLDVNGSVPTDNDSETVGNFASNNEKSFSQRRFSASVVASLYGLSDNYDEGTNFAFEASSLIRSSLSFDITFAGSGVTRDAFVISATALTEAGLNSYFSINLCVMREGMEGADAILSRERVVFKVEVRDTFAQRDNANNAFTVGYKVNSDGNEYLGSDNNAQSFVNGVHASVLTISNNSTFTVDMSEYLQDRALFKSGTNEALKYSVGGVERYWTIKSVVNFAIDSVRISEMTTQKIDNVIKVGSVAYNAASNTAPIRVSPSFTASVYFTQQDVQQYDQRNTVKFWDTTFTLEVTLYQVGSPDTRSVVNIPFKFQSANPVSKSINADRLRLNKGSQYGLTLSTMRYYDLDNNNEIVASAADQKQVVITPSDLIDYAFPSTGYRDMTFDHLSVTVDDTPLTEYSQNGAVIVRRETADEEADALYPTRYIIEANSQFNSSYDTSHRLKFTVTYDVMKNGLVTPDSVDVEITVSVYGGYAISFAPIRGKKDVTYNALTDDIFADMRSRGYMLVDATSTDEDKLYAHFESNILTFTPKAKANVPITLTFKNALGQTVKFESSSVDVDVNAGSFFARFEDWEAGLIIAAICLAGLILILFIVWLFIRAISKRRQEEAATQAPVSSYIVKLNSTIAANQAQQRAAQTAALSQASQMLLGAGPTSTAAPPPDTLQLASGVQSQPGAMSMPGGSMSMPGSGPAMSEPQATIPPDSDEGLYELIAKYITDDELLERIFTEKYEPKGMVRRTFFKSKDTQARELEKEKKRIIERYKKPMPMDEAIMSESEIQKQTERTSSSSAPVEQAEPQTEMFVLDFDPEAPLYVEPEVTHDEFSEEKIDIDTSPEEQALKDVSHKLDVLQKELAELKTRLDKVQTERDKAKSLEDDLRERIARAEEDDAQFAKDIEELEFKLASAKNKEKPIITRDLGIKEEKKQRNLQELEQLRAELDALLGNSEKLNAVYDKLDGQQSERLALLESLNAQRDKAQAEFDAYQERLAQVRARQELEAKVTSLTPLLENVNNVSYEMKKLQADSEEQSKERDTLKAAIATAKAQIVATTDFGVIGDLNMQIADANARLSELDKEVAKTTKRNSELNIEFNSHRRKANEFIETNDIPLEEVIKAEDVVIGNIELELLKADRQRDKDEAEKAVAEAQAVCDDLSASSGDVAMVAMEVAAGINDIEEEISAAQAELDDINLQMETAGEDEKLMLMVEQGDKADKIEELKAKLEQAHVDGTKRKMEAQSDYDAKLEQAHKALDDANAEFGRACTVYDELMHNTNPIDLIVSGSGIISQDQKIIEAENLKKQLERSKNEIEAARLAAQQAQEEAERIRLEAERATEEARQEAERAAEEARLEAERAAEEARQEAERAAEEARLEAERAAEEARQEAERAAEEARLEAERAKEEALAAAEQARLEAEEKARADVEAAERAKQEATDALTAESEEAKRKAQEEAEEAKRKAQEEIDEMRRQAEADAEAKRLAEENKQKEEAERAKADAERNEVIAKKVAMRKEQIIAIRNEMKELKGDEDAKNLRERLYNIQLTYDEDERGASELMDFYNKTMDDIQSAGEIARLKAENAKKPQRVVRKVTERVNRIPKRRPGARPARPGARPSSARPGARPARPGARPAGARPARPGAPRPTSGARPTRPGAPRPGSRPTRPR